MLKANLIIVSALFLSACLPASGSMRTCPPAGSKATDYERILAEEDVNRIKNETFEEVLHRPHPAREREMIRNLPTQPLKKEQAEVSERFLSDEGFPLITFRGGPISLGEAVEFIAGSAGYRVEWKEGINKALPVTTAFTKTPLDKAVALLLKPFGYVADLDSREGVVKVGFDEKEPS